MSCFRLTLPMSMLWTPCRIVALSRRTRLETLRGTCVRSVPGFHSHVVERASFRHVDVRARPWALVLTRSNLALAEGEVYSQPANTGVGVHESTQLVAAIDALKVCICRAAAHNSARRTPCVWKTLRLCMDFPLSWMRMGVCFRGSSGIQRCAMMKRQTCGATRCERPGARR